MSDDITPRRLLPQPRLAQTVQVGTETVTNWLHRGYIKGYRVEGTRVLHFDLDEVERAFKIYGPAKMRDGRRRGAKGRVVRAVIVPAEERDQ